MGDHRDERLPTFKKDVCIVLVNPQTDGNIGAVARSMLNFGFTDLRIVGRTPDWSEEARNRAKNAQTVLEKSQCFESFQDAISDCSIVVGTSGKREDGDKTAMRHFLLPDELPSRLSNAEGRVALVFGPEGKGLLNEELSMCDLLVTIPTWEGYPILNLSHAVTVICYSWFISSDRSTPFGAGERLLEPELRIRLRQEIARLTEKMPAKDHRRKGIEETLVRVILRGLPKDDEIHRLLGVISEAADSFEKNDS
ncbi:MAG: rRNA methyltransferase [Chloroflexi bacterium]|nr:rRNA methyltransferase [Chloroflexota bacterium]|tara:strand:+ start:3755 stop:4513 length:759 start_codon:yes stop_codon:yes gene_type:complete